MRNKKAERDKEIVAKLLEGKYTEQEIASLYHISRQRVDQIFNKMTGRTYLDRYKKEKEKRDKDNEIFLNTVKFCCAGCGKPVTYREAQGRHLLCEACGIKDRKNRRVWGITYVCDWCKTPYHPYASRIYRKKDLKGTFCSNHCYQASLKLAKHSKM
jgi:hypothetical protein